MVSETLGAPALILVHTDRVRELHFDFRVSHHLSDVKV
jgi:hypothetical protein